MGKQSEKHRNVTIMDVAEKSGVSIATVSRVLNRTGRYSDETSRKVEAVVREIDYTPNHVAKSLKRKRTEQIALAVSDIGNPVYVAMARAVQRVVKAHGYRLVLLSTEALISEELGIIESLSKQYVDGLIISPLLYGAQHRELIKMAKKPIVVIAGAVSDPEIDSVLVDSSQGVRLAMEHLLDQGYSRIAFLNGPRDTVPGVSRLNGYYASLIEHGLPQDDSLVFSSDFTLAGGYREAAKMITNVQRPHAIMCANDLMALGVIRSLLERGIKVPHDVAVVGMDDIENGASSFPSLTTVSLLAAERGRMAAELLLEGLTSEEARTPRQLEVVPRLIVRESSVVYKG
mgnify:CR=1 FL=1|jgi:LacI family transcriptional regulator